MTSQAVDFTPAAWILLFAWIVFNLVIFVLFWSWLASIPRQDGDFYVRLQVGLNRVMIIAVVDVIWATAILMAAGIDSQNLICLPVIILVVLVPIYLRYRRFYRKMLQENQDQSTH